MILWAPILALLPMLARSSIHCVCSAGFKGGGVMTFLIDWKVVMSGLLWRYVWEWVHVAWITLRMLWCIFNWRFHSFCCILGRNPP